jgi:DNA-binding NtrC family response regulator
MARILLAESDQHIRRFIAGILADCGHAVETCNDAVEASLSLATRAIDVVVTDFVLGLAGGEANLGRDCAALGIPTVTLSGSEFVPAQAVTERPPALLEKPFRFGDLHNVLDAVALREPVQTSGRTAGPGDRRPIYSPAGPRRA